VAPIECRLCAPANTHPSQRQRKLRHLKSLEQHSRSQDTMKTINHDTADLTVHNRCQLSLEMSHGGQSGMRTHTCSSGVICTPHCFQRLATLLQYTSNHTLSCDWDLSVSENLLAEVTELFFRKGSKPTFIRGIGTTRHLCINCRAMRICAFSGMMDPVAEVTEFLLR
jgi:hypothetical protein